MPRPINIIGQRFGRLLVLSEAPPYRSPQNKPYRASRCACDCGKHVVVLNSHLRTKQTTSCGCLLVEVQTTHGQSKTPEYRVWECMHTRCKATTGRDKAWYADRGIFVCEEWRTFERFISDMGPRPSPKHTLDRIDNSGPYSRENCRWAHPFVQQGNKRNNRFVTHDGETLHLAEWARRCGVPYATLRSRLKRGWDVHRAMSP